LCKVFQLSDDHVIELPPKSFKVDNNYKYIVSVGSVGQPRDYDNRASYTVFDTDKNEFEFKRIEYDIDSAANKIFKGDMERNFGHRLFIGV
jgi:diadenosine tetraphosphatase ApaH/serine/threonine PP2A family protein phosphatase